MSETIVAAMIGAGATICTALFQLFSVFKSRSRVDTRPRRAMWRSWLAIMVLTLGSAVSGYLYSEFLKQHAMEDLHAMRQELHEALAASAEQLRRATAPVPGAAAATPTTHAVADTSPALSDTFVLVPACHATAEAPCEEATAPSLTLCAAAVPGAHVLALYAQPQAADQTTSQQRAEIDSDIGGAKFTRVSSSEATPTASCVLFTHWNTEHGFAVRLLVEPLSAAPAMTPSVIAAGPAAGLPGAMAAASPAN